MSRENLPGYPGSDLPDFDDLYSEAELARAYAELDRILPDYTVQKLHEACVQARKNRLWDRHAAEQVP